MFIGYKQDNKTNQYKDSMYHNIMCSLKLVGTIFCSYYRVVWQVVLVKYFITLIMKRQTYSSPWAQTHSYTKRSSLLKLFTLNALVCLQTTKVVAIGRSFPSDPT